MPKNKKQKRKRNPRGSRNRGFNKPRRRIPGKTNRRAPAAYGSSLKTISPLKNVRIRHREFVADIVSSATSFERLKFVINPGTLETFPWLHGIASAFETYQFTFLKFIWEPSVGTDVPGSVALCPDYDPSDDNSKLTKAQLLSFEDSIRTPLWAKAVMQSTPRNLRKRKIYVVDTTHAGETTDLKDFHTGSLEVGLSSTYVGTVGELYVEYEVLLTTPQVELPIECDARVTSTFPSGATAPFSDTTTISGLSPLISNVKDAITVVNPSTLAFHKPGRYEFSARAYENGTGINLTHSPTVGGLASIVSSFTSQNAYPGNNGIVNTIIDIAANATKETPGYFYWTGVNGAADQFISLISQVDPGIVTGM